jgi:hypothetical protein
MHNYYFRDKMVLSLRLDFALCGAKITYCLTQCGRGFGNTTWEEKNFCQFNNVINLTNVVTANSFQVTIYHYFTVSNYHINRDMVHQNQILTPKHELYSK